jgi:hypothetical protein
MNLEKEYFLIFEIEGNIHVTKMSVYIPTVKNYRRSTKLLQNPINMR